MKKDFETNFTAWTLITAAILLIAGWELSSHKLENILSLLILQKSVKTFGIGYGCLGFIFLVGLLWERP